MDDVILKLRLLIRAELAILQSQSRVAGHQAVLLAFALVLLLIALGGLNLAIYLALSEIYSASSAALIVAGGNALIAFIIIFIALRLKPGAEVEMAKEISELAAGELSADIEEIEAEFRSIGENVRQITQGFQKLSRGDFSGIALATLGPILGSLTRSITKKS